MAAKEKKGLGAGLGVLFGEETYHDENELKILPVSKLEPRREQPRTVFDDEALRELADSLSRYGVIQPVTVRALPSGYYQIIAGERRWRAARLAGLEEIPTRVIEADDRRASELALVENLQREDLNPIEEARGYKTLMEDYGLTQEETARSVGRSRPAVANALRLLGLSPAVMALVERKELSAGHARAILPLESEKQQLELAQEVLKKSLSVRRTEQLAARLNRVSAAKEQKESPLIINYAAEAAEELSRLLGRKVHLVEGKRGGKIELDYYDPEDREVLIAALRDLAKRKEA